MKVTEEFVVQESPERLWEFLGQIERVARCMPGVEDIEVIDEDNSKLRVTQALGPMSATFDLKMRITERDPGKTMGFTAIGRTVRGAAGNIRSANVVRLEELPEGGTKVLLDADVALGGMIGSVGQKVVAKQAGKVTRVFAESLAREIRGESSAAPAQPTAPAAGSALRSLAAPSGTPIENAAVASVGTAAGQVPSGAPAQQMLTAAPVASLLRTNVPVPLPLLLGAVFAAGALAGRVLGRRR